MSSLRCHFDDNGWLQGPIAISHYTSPNHYASGFAAKARGMVQHTEDGYTAGTVATFMNKAAEVSAFFGVGEDGAAQQFLPVGRGLVAWAEGHGNPEWYSCECEDKTRTGDPMTGPQVQAFAQILEACSARDGFPLQITDSVGGTGLITHGDGGSDWGGHLNCPGTTRRAQRPTILELAEQIRGGTAPAPKLATWTCMGQLSLAALCAKSLKNAASTVVRLTAEHYNGGVFTSAMAGYLDEVFAKDTVKVPQGVRLLLGSQWFVATGNQTLQGISLGRKIGVSTILRETVEHSDGDLFASNLAAYINGVFARSTILIPSGVHLIYQV